MESQRYPERHYTPGGELIRPYDITSWSLPLHMGVRSIQVDTRSETLEALLEPVTGEDLSSDITLPENVWAIAYPSTSNQSYKAVFAALKAGLKVGRFTHPFGREGEELPAGSFVILAGSASRDQLARITEQASIEPRVFESEITVPVMRVRSPRIALVETHFHDMDAGWTRYLFDTYGIVFRVLHPEDFEDADLKGDFDVIVFPDASKDVLTKGKYKRFDRYVSNDYPPQFRKPISKKGLGKLTEFITDGGVVVSWGRSTGLFTERVSRASPCRGHFWRWTSSRTIS